AICRSWTEPSGEAFPQRMLFWIPTQAWLAAATPPPVLHVPVLFTIVQFFSVATTACACSAPPKMAVLPLKAQLMNSVGLPPITNAPPPLAPRLPRNLQLAMRFVPPHA